MVLHPDRGEARGRIQKLSTTVAELSDEVGVSTTSDDEPSESLVEVLRKWALPLALAGVMSMLPGASSTATTMQLPRDPGTLRADSSTYRQAVPRLSALGWAFAQRVSEEARLAPTGVDYDENDESYVEPPDPSLWEHLPLTRWT